MLYDLEKTLLLPPSVRDSSYFLKTIINYSTHIPLSTLFFVFCFFFLKFRVFSISATPILCFPTFMAYKNKAIVSIAVKSFLKMFKNLSVREKKLSCLLHPLPSERDRNE